MTVETDALADTAVKFSAAVRAERASTFEALAAERQAALKIIEALRAERGRRSAEASGRFVFGVALGVAAGIAAIYLVSQRASEEARLGLTAAPIGGDEGGAGVKERLQRAIADGKRAARGREDELWQQYRKRIAEGKQPPPEERYY